METKELEEQKQIFNEAVKTVNEKAIAIKQPDPMTMIAMAIEKGLNADTIKQLMDLRDREQARIAKEQFTIALNKFKANPPEIVKNKHVKYETTKGFTEYDHVTLDELADKVGKELSLYGLSFRWATEQKADKISVSCILTHILGHSEIVTLESAPDQSGGKNGIQAIGSALTYLERYTLQAVTGIAVGLPDDDGRATEVRDCVSEENIADWITQIGNADTDKELRKVFFASVDVAKKHNDKHAEAEFIKAKDIRKAELERITK